MFIITRKTYKTKYLDTIRYRKFSIIENKNSMQVEIFSRIDASLVFFKDHFWIFADYGFTEQILIFQEGIFAHKTKNGKKKGNV